MMRVLLTSVALLGLVGTAHSADVQQIDPPQAVETREIIIDLGLGAQVQPKFPTSREYEVVPYPIIRLRFLRLPVFGEVVTGQERAFSIYPSFGFIGERNASDASYLAGTPTVDFAVELGAGAAYRRGPFRVFGELRYGVTGHNGFVGQLGADAIVNPFERLEFRFGPRLGFADNEYMDTYFGVANATPFLPAFDADAGVRDVGVTAEATYRLTDKLDLHGRASFTTYVGDAADSPITQNGNTVEGRAGIGLTYRFGLDLY